MGITDFSVVLLNRVFEKYPDIKTVAELGDQNLYTSDGNYGKYADLFYEEKGIRYFCIDINGGNNAWAIDLSKVQNVNIRYDLVSDFGVSEHIGIDGKFDWEAIYNCWLNKHNLLKDGGIMINENPKDGNWYGHGFNYYTQEFYTELVKYCGYEILELGEFPAMGNTTDGWNIYCTLKKVSGQFITLDQFKILPLKSNLQQNVYLQNTMCANGVHKVGDIAFAPARVELDGKICNCGKIKFEALMCGCVEDKLELKMFPNV